MKVRPYKETHMDGTMLLEKIPEEFEQQRMMHCDFGIQIAEDGRVWICINGVSFLRFSPTGKYVAVEAKLIGGNASEQET